MCKKIVFMVMTVLVAISADAQATHDTDRLRQRIDVWLDSVSCQPDWLLSRLQMYWSTHATDVYINGEAFDHPGGERAPKQTVKFNGQRSSASGYQLPKLEDVVPYDDDNAGSVTFVDKLTGAKEKTHPSKTGGNIDAQNRRVLGIARDAARIYSATGELAFAGGHLYAYSYLYDKLSTESSDDIMARFVIDSPQQTTMTMWMQGQAERKIFRALAPVNREYERLGDYMPYKVDEQPVLTYVARQQGDAWEKPFVAIFEPSDADGPAEVEHVSFFRPESREASVVGICVRLRGGRTDYVFSSPVKTKMRYQGMTVNARYAVISNGIH